MKKMIFSFMLFIWGATAWAQEPASASAPVSAEQSQWLPEFTEINISGPFNVVFEQVPQTEAPRIVYNTKGSYTSRFHYEVRNNILYVSEKSENRRTTTSEVKICCHNLNKLRISGATASFATPVEGVIADLTVGGGAFITLPVKVTDLKLDVSGKSRVVLTGAARYLSLTISTAKVDALQLDAMSVDVDASNNAEVSVNATERMEARVATGALVSYKGNPAVVRATRNFTGGTITKIE